MNSRERILAALNHREPDRVPFDLGGTVVTGINIHAYRALRRHLGLPPGEPKIVDIIQQIARVDDDAMNLLGVDVKNVSPRSSATFQIRVQDFGEYTGFRDEWGIGWRMPKKGGWYYDMREHPLAGPISEEAVDRYPWPDPLDPARFAGIGEAARRILREEGRAVIMGGMSAGILEMHAWLRGFEDAYADFGANPRLAGRLMDKVLEMKMAYWGKALEILGDAVDVVQEADDFAGQSGLLLSPRTYREIAKPRHKALFDFIHARTKAKIFFHSCGAVRKVIPDLIEAGVDILNPVQVSAAGMDTAELKREFGKDLTFWGGGVDTQRVLGTGTPDEVRREVRRRIEDLKPGGGFVFAAVHNIQGNVPVENIVAMWEAFREFGSYGG